MQKMRPSQSIKRMQSRKSHSWWWDSHISRKNSKWLAENLTVMDQSVKEMLKLIEEEGDSFAKKAEMYYERRPKLISHVEDFYRMYRALAERYDQVTGELRKNIKSELQSQSSGEGLDAISEASSPTAFQPSEVTPMSKSRQAMLTTRAAGFSVFLGSGGSSDASKKSSNDDGSSSSSSSDSETEVDDLSEANGDDDDSAVLHEKIMELENELHEAKDKLKFYEQDGPAENGKHSDGNTKVSELEQRLSEADKRIRDSEAQILELQRKLEESEDIVSERKKVSELEGQITLLQSEVEEYKKETNVVKEKSQQEKATLESRIADLEDINSVLNGKVDEYAANIAELEVAMNELKAANESRAEKLTHEKQELATKLSSLLEELKYCEEKRAQMELELRHSQLEHGKLTAELERVRKSSSELQLRVKELEEEIDKHKVAVSDSAEGKREAIRQLCFSLEHYRDGYHQLRQLLNGHKTARITAS